MDSHIGQIVLPIARQVPGGGFKVLGTCFAVGPRRLATAAHVTGPSDEGMVAIVDRLDNFEYYQDTTNKAAKAAYLRIMIYDPIRDICILELIHDDVRSFGYKIVSFGYEIGSSDAVVPGSPVLSFGFPHADYGRVVLTQQASMVGARILLGVEAVKVKHLVLNTQTRPGQSGGPVFTGDGRTICAMVVGGYSPSYNSPGRIAGIDPLTLHQTTHAVSAEYIMEFL